MAESSFVKPLRVLTWSNTAGAEWALVQLCVSGDEEACGRLERGEQQYLGWEDCDV